MLLELLKKSCLPILLFALMIVSLIGLLESLIQEEAARPKVIQVAGLQPSPVTVPKDQGWTWVIASKSNEADAILLADQYRKNMPGLRVRMLESRATDTTRYRVTVGIFSEKTEAQQALDQLALPPDAWMLHLGD